MTLRTTAIVATASALALGAAAPAHAQSRCGPSYIMQPGDMLCRVSQGCRVSLVRCTPGQYVQVTGPRAEMSSCQQGAATIDMRETEEIAPPQDDPEGGTTLEGRVREGTECPVLETPDGDRYALTSGEITFNTGEYVRVSGARVEMSYCMEGIATLNVTDLQEVRLPQ